MKKITLCLLTAYTAQAWDARSLPSMPPGHIVAHSSAITKVYLGSPSLAVLEDGRYIATFDTFGPNSPSNRTTVVRSDDRGNTWKYLTSVSNQYWSTLFVVHGALYMMGTDQSMGTPIIRRSVNEGQTWSTPTSPSTGRFAISGRYVTAPVPVVIANQRIWRSFEVVDQGDLKEQIFSSPVDQDLLDTSNWIQTKPLSSTKGSLGNHFLSWEEGNIAVVPHGPPVALLRVNTSHGPEKAALVTISNDGRSLSFDPQNDFVDFPGGGKKFTIRFDSKSRRYWSITNFVPGDNTANNLERVRNTLALTSSTDLRHWRVERILLQHCDPAKYGFQYADWQFSGDDIIAVVRMSYDDDEGGAHNQHDSNFISFFRFPDFRKNAP